MTPHPSATWSDEDRERIRDMWMVKGLSASQIAAEFPGKTRNAIIGVVNRLGLSGQRERRGNRSQLDKPKPHRIPVKRVAIKPAAPVVPEHAPAPFVAREVEAGPLHIAFTDLRADHCRYPYGNSDFTYCGQPKGDGPYCPVHALLCYQPIVARKQRQADKNSLWHAQRV